ncbi:MAG: phage tail tape measure protein [Clostridiales bacterium]|nr:phage tail tape measure protein [Clostridiales bacterium]
MANRIAGITVEIGGDTTKLQTALKSVNSEIKSTQSQLKDVNNLLKLDPTNTELLTQKQKLLTEAISETKEKLTTLKTAAEQANEQLQNGEITQEQYDALQREIVDTEEKLKSLADQAAESNAALVKIGEAGETLESVGDSISGVGTKLLGVTTAVVALGTAAVTTTADFETAMSKVKSLISSSSTDLEGDMERLEEAAREAGETTKFSAAEAAEAMPYMGLAGWSADEMIDSLDGILNLAAASEMDLATASDIVTDYLSAFGLTAADSGTLVDKMAYAMSNSNTSTEQLGEAYKNCAATATQLGYGLDETTAALMVMADAGIKGGEAGTALSSIMTRLGNNTSGCTDMLESYGIEVYDAQGNVNSLSNILSGMQDIWADLTDEEKANLAYVVAGKTAQSELMTVLGETTGSFEEHAAGLADCSGTAENMTEIMQDNLSGQLTILKSQLQELAISFGEILMPTIKNIVSWIQNLVDKLNNMDEGTRETIVKVGLLVAAIGPLLIVIGKTISTVGTAMKGFSSLGTSILKIVNHAKTGTGMIGKLVTAIGGISAPVVAVVAVIGVLVAAFATLWNTNEEFRGKITSIWNGIKETISGFVDGIRERFADLGINLGDLGDMVEVLKNIWLEFCNLLAPVFEGAFSVISSVLSTVLDVILGLLDAFIGIFTGDWEQAWTGVKEIFSGIWEGIKGILSAVLETIKGIVNVLLG